MVTNEELAVAYRQGDCDALPILWAQVARLATVMVKRYRSLAESNRAVDFDDLLQAAFLAVERAARAFREGEGSFVSVMDFYVKTEVAALLGLRGRMRWEHYESVPTSTPIGEEGTATIGDMIADEGLPDEDEVLHRDDVRQEVHAAIGRLRENQALVVREHMLGGMTQEVLAAQMGISRGRVHQIAREAHRRLRRDRRLSSWQRIRYAIGISRWRLSIGTGQAARKRLHCGGWKGKGVRSQLIFSCGRFSCIRRYRRP